MIIDASEKFSQRNTKNWFQKLSGSTKRMPSKVIPLPGQQAGSGKTASVSKLDTLTQTDITHLHNSASLLVIHCEEITINFYKSILKTMWWDHKKFDDVVDCERNRLLTSLLTLVETPTETSQIAFFLADNWVKYRHLSDLGESYDTITYLLNNAIDDVLGEYFTSEVCMAWRKALTPNHVFARTPDVHTLKN